MQRRLFTVISALVIMVNIVLSPLAGATATVSDHAWQGAPKATGNDCIDEEQGTRPDCRTVMATHVAGGWVYAGGSIDGVRSGNGSIKYTQFRNLFRYNPVTGAVDTSFAPHFYTDSSTTTTPNYSVVPSGMVRKIVSGPGNSIFVAGDFRQVKSSSTGKIYTQRGLAKINTTNGDVDRTFKPNIGCITIDRKSVV